MWLLLLQISEVVTYESWSLTNTKSFWFNFVLYSEFIGEDGNEKFWQFVDTVKELTVYKQGGMLVL